MVGKGNPPRSTDDRAVVCSPAEPTTCPLMPPDDRLRDIAVFHLSSPYRRAHAGYLLLGDPKFKTFQGAPRYELTVNWCLGRMDGHLTRCFPGEKISAPPDQFSTAAARRDLAARSARVFARTFPLSEKQGRRECRARDVARQPQPRQCKIKVSNTSVVTTVTTPKPPGNSRAIVFYTPYIVTLLGDRLYLPPSPGDVAQEDRTSRVTPRRASGPHTSPSACTSLVSDI